MSDNLPNYTLYVQNLNDKIRKEELKRSLYYLFSNYGRILEIVASKTAKCRGQAFIVFSEIPFATLALRNLQDFNLFGKNMKISYAKTTSKAIKIATGFQVNDNQLNGVNGINHDDDEMDVDPVRPLPTTHVPQIKPGDQPNRVLFVENLSEQATKNNLEQIFQQYPGFLEVRMIEGNNSIAFIDYESVNQAAVVKEGLDNFKLFDQPIQITFAK